MSTRRLQYNYAIIDLETGRCRACLTMSYEVDDPAYIVVPRAYDDYVGKYYHDGSWYEDAEFTIPWTINRP